MKKNTSYGILEQARQAGLAKPSAGMTVPEGYFADFAERMSSQLPERPEAECVQAPPAVADKSLWQKVRPYVYMAAMFAGIWLMLQMFAMLGGQNRIGDIGDSKVLAEAMGDDDFVFDYFSAISILMKSSTRWLWLKSHFPKRWSSTTVSCMNQATALRKNYKSMIRLIGILSLAVISWMSMAADAQNNQCANRQRYLSEVRDHKHEFLARELAIPQENRREFFELYDAMENELMVLDTETRQLERDMRRDTTPATCNSKVLSLLSIHRN